MCFRLIHAKKSQHPVSLLCGVLGVSRAGYYAWKDRPASARKRRDAELIERIGGSTSTAREPRAGPRVHAELRHRGVRASRKRVARLMRQAGLWAWGGGARARPRPRARHRHRSGSRATRELFGHRSGLSR
jgi:hypothetical protein